MPALPNRTRPELAEIGTQAAQPVAGSVDINIRRASPIGTLADSKFYRMDITLKAARIAVTDAGASGASGSLLLFTFIQQAIAVLSSRQDYTAFAEGAALTGAAGDSTFTMGLGSVAANAGDGVLTGTEVDFAPVTGTITLSSGTGAGTKMGAATTSAIDGTTTANALYLNWCGFAATNDADSTIDVTGTISLTFAMLGDD